MEKYDVVIVGAGPGGLECAYNLGNSKLQVLVLEKNQIIGPKVCAGGFTLKDMDWVPKNLLDYEFSKARVYYQNRSISIQQKYKFLATIDREKLGQFQLRRLENFSNIKIRTKIALRKINNKHNLELNNGEKIEFKYLVGADGSLSEVRKFLGLDSEKMAVAIQYIISKQFNNLDVFFDRSLFGSGYAWIFPHKNYDSIGCGAEQRYFSAKRLKNNFDKWLKMKNINVANGEFQATLINCDYQGYRFENIYLVGDAAGLTSGLTGEGIFSAIISGRQAARDILGNNQDNNLIQEWLIKKHKQEKYLSWLRSPAFIKDIIFPILFWLIRFPKVQKRAKKLILE